MALTGSGHSMHALHPRWWVLLFALITVACFTSARSAHGGILGNSSAEVNLTDATQAQQQCAWSDPARIQVDEKGLGWGAAADEGSRDFWLQTIKPIALGESWRPPISANVRVTIDHVGTSGI